MSNYTSKVYVVQKFDRDEQPGAVIAVKLTWDAAHQIARRYAPAKVIFANADKDPTPNVAQNGAHYRALP